MDKEIKFISIQFTDEEISLVGDSIDKDAITKIGYPTKVGISKIVFHFGNGFTQTLSA